MPDAAPGVRSIRLAAAVVWLALSACSEAAPGAGPQPTPATASLLSPPKPLPQLIPQPIPQPALAVLAARNEPPALLIPVQGITASQLRDTFDQGRDGKQRSHEALDILAPLGTPVLAVDDGTIVKLFLSKPGGITIYQFDAGRQFTYYYAHLDRYADGIAEGQSVRRGTVIGYVGASGNANPAAPHLHFAVFRMGPEKQWWKGEPLNPFGYLGGRKP